MAHIVEMQVDTPLVELRQRLDRAERQLPALASGDLRDYLRSLDRLDELFTTSAAEGADLRPEMTRWLDLQARLGARAGQLVRLSGAEGGFASLRTQNPPATGAWWRLDQLVAAKRKRNWTRLAAALAAIVLVLAVFAFVYARWLAPSPDVLMVISTLNDVEQLAMEQKWDEASAVVEEALQATPDDADLLIWAAVLAEQRGAAQDAARYLAEAERAVGDPLRLQLTLGMRRLQAGDLEGVEAAALAAQAISADEPQAVFLLGNVAEMRNDTPLALELYQRTADLAEDDNPQLTVVAKMRYGMLLQQFQFAVETPAASAIPAPAATPIP